MFLRARHAYQEGQVVKRADDVIINEENVMYCNCCGKILKAENGILLEDAFEATKEWGYFSEKDMEVHHFNLCEDCYNKLISEFKIPVEVRRKLEVL
jgi:ribosomal-protein-alanine N-acetyltransferase